MKKLEFKDLENQELDVAKTAPLVGVDFVNTIEAKIDAQNDTNNGEGPLDYKVGRQKQSFFKAVFGKKEVEEKPEIYKREDTIPPKWALVKAMSQEPEAREEKLTIKKNESREQAKEKPIKKNSQDFYVFVPQQELNENKRIKLEIKKPKNKTKTAKTKKAKKIVEKEIIMPKKEEKALEKGHSKKTKKARKHHSPFQIFTWVLGALTLPFVFFFSLVLFFGSETILEKLVMLLIFLMVFALSAGPMYVGGYVSITGQTSIFKLSILQKNPFLSQIFGVFLFLFGATLFYFLFWKQLFGVII